MKDVACEVISTSLSRIDETRTFYVQWWNLTGFFQHMGPFPMHGIQEEIKIKKEDWPSWEIFDEPPTRY